MYATFICCDDALLVLQNDDSNSNYVYMSQPGVCTKYTTQFFLLFALSKVPTL